MGGNHFWIRCKTFWNLHQLESEILNSSWNSHEFSLVVCHEPRTPKYTLKFGVGNYKAPHTLMTLECGIDFTEFFSYLNTKQGHQWSYFEVSCVIIVFYYLKRSP